LSLSFLCFFFSLGSSSLTGSGSGSFAFTGTFFLSLLRGDALDFSLVRDAASFLVSISSFCFYICGYSGLGSSSYLYLEGV
jgi:hypothetical protein